MFRFWRRHKKKIFVTLGIVGSGYVLYKFYDAHKNRLSQLERQLAVEREIDLRIKAQMQEHFEMVQRIADTTTLPHAMSCLSSRIDEELNLSVLTDSLKLGKDTLTLSEKLELWDRLKVLSFTKMVVSMWAATMLILFVRVQVNILGRHLYIDFARGLESSPLLEEDTVIDHDDEQNFLSCADFLAKHSLPALIRAVQAAAEEILKSKQLKDAFDSTVLQETMVQILDTFMSMGGSHHWMVYLIQQDSKIPSLTSSSSSNHLVLSDISRFEQLKSEALAVFSSDEFTNIIEVSLKTVANRLVEEVIHPSGAGSSLSGIPLVKLVPRVAQMSQLLLDEPSQNQFIQVIGSIPDVEMFFTLLYANTSTV